MQTGLRISAGRLPVESLAELWRLSGLSGVDDDPNANLKNAIRVEKSNHLLIL